MSVRWGLLGPESLAGTRRTRTLGLGASVRAFNDRAVPGIGGVWFCKELFLATLGVVVAEEVRTRGMRVNNIEVTNAIEAVACWLALTYGESARDARLRGSTKLPGKQDLRFSTVRRPGFYVTQPMRMASVQALPALGLVETDTVRFNGFQSTQDGRDFVELASRHFRPFRSSVVEYLVGWVMGKTDRVNSRELCGALSPIAMLPTEAMPLLRERLLQGSPQEPAESRQRRQDALAWVEALRVAHNPRVSWAKPREIREERHWHDIHAGACFFLAREAAIGVLDAVERYMVAANTTKWTPSTTMPGYLQDALEQLRERAGDFLSRNHADAEAVRFCQECCRESPAEVIAKLVQRDGQVLRLVGNEVRPGSAFNAGIQVGTVEDGPVGAEAEEPAPSFWPAGISYRLRNLYLLNCDLQGTLADALNTGLQGGESNEQA